MDKTAEVPTVSNISAKSSDCAGNIDRQGFSGLSSPTAEASNASLKSTNSIFRLFSSPKSSGGVSPKSSGAHSPISDKGHCGEAFGASDDRKIEARQWSSLPSVVTWNLAAKAAVPATMHISPTLEITVCDSEVANRADDATPDCRPIGKIQETPHKFPNFSTYWALIKKDIMSAVRGKRYLAAEYQKKAAAGLQLVETLKQEQRDAEEHFAVAQADLEMILIKAVDSLTKAEAARKTWGWMSFSAKTRDRDIAALKEKIESTRVSLDQLRTAFTIAHDQLREKIDQTQLEADQNLEHAKDLLKSKAANSLTESVSNSPTTKTADSKQTKSSTSWFSQVRLKMSGKQAPASCQSQYRSMPSVVTWHSPVFTPPAADRISPSKSGTTLDHPKKAGTTFSYFFRTRQEEHQLEQPQSSAGFRNLPSVVTWHNPKLALEKFGGESAATEKSLVLHKKAIQLSPSRSASLSSIMPFKGLSFSFFQPKKVQKAHAQSQDIQLSQKQETEIISNSAMENDGSQPEQGHEEIVTDGDRLISVESECPGEPLVTSTLPPCDNAQPDEIEDSLKPTAVPTPLPTASSRELASTLPSVVTWRTPPTRAAAVSMPSESATVPAPAPSAGMAAGAQNTSKGFSMKSLLSSLSSPFTPRRAKSSSNVLKDQAGGDGPGGLDLRQAADAAAMAPPHSPVGSPGRLSEAGTCPKEDSKRARVGDSDEPLPCGSLLRAFESEAAAAVAAAAAPQAAH